jgi:hypothetical protein
MGQVFGRVLQAYSANIPTALDLSLADSVVASVPFLPAGPESADVDAAAELALYELSPKRCARRSPFGSERSLCPMYSKALNSTWIGCEIDIRAIVDAREQAEPDSFFDIRHQSLGPGALLEASLPEFLEQAATTSSASPQ